jgi:hypothetical protein
MLTPSQAAAFSLELDHEERAELASLLERELRETRVEARRTEDPDYQEQVHQHGTVLRRVLERLRTAGPATTKSSA